MGVQVTFTNHFHEIADALPQLAHQIVYATGLNVLHGSQENIKRQKLIKTGYLLNSGHIEPIDAYSLYVVFSADYAAYPELGTIHMAARPYLRPAVEHERQPFQDAWSAIGRTGALNTLGGSL